MIASEAHDPTASATRYSAISTDQVFLSGNEIETLCLKAARGAGMAWGMAEEAAFAAGWLSGAGVDGPSLLLRHLQGLNAASGIPIMSDRHWRAASDGALCPITIGAALDDRANLDDGPSAGAITVSAVRYPCLTVPFLARMAQAMRMTLRFEWGYGTLDITETGAIDGDLWSLSLIEQSGLKIASLSGKTSIRPTDAFSSTTIPALSASVLRELNALAMRTTVPASDASRQGAGAASHDND